MLDAYIIERIRQEQERQRKDTRLPLHIERDREPPRPPAVTPPSEPPPHDDAGGAVIDFRL